MAYRELEKPGEESARVKVRVRWASLVRTIILGRYWGILKAKMQDVDCVLGECSSSHTETMWTSHLSISSKAMRTGTRSLPRAGTLVHSLPWFYGTGKIRQYTFIIVREKEKLLPQDRC